MGPSNQLIVLMEKPTKNDVRQNKQKKSKKINEKNPKHKKSKKRNKKKENIVYNLSYFSLRFCGYQ